MQDEEVKAPQAQEMVDHEDDDNDYAAADEYGEEYEEGDAQEDEEMQRLKREKKEKFYNEVDNEEFF